MYKFTAIKSSKQILGKNWDQKNVDAFCKVLEVISSKKILKQKINDSITA